MGKKKKQPNWPAIANWKPYMPSGQQKQQQQPSAGSQADKEKFMTPEEKQIEFEKQLEVPPGWKEPGFEPEDNPNGRLFATSSFSTLFPKYREKYLRQVWPQVKKLLKEHFIRAELDAVEGTMLVKTTPKTFDPMAIVKARDLISLLARSMPLEQAQAVMQDDTFADIIGIHLPNRARFVKRRDRLIGPDGATLKAIELLTKCSIKVQGKTVCAVGPWTGLRQVRQLVLDTMQNIHPVYSIKTLMIKQKLREDPRMAGLSWDRFLPKFKPKTLSKRRKPHKIREKKAYTPFPPAPVESKVDSELREGTYFLKADQKLRLKQAERRQKQAAKTKERQRQRASVFEPPPE
uniref:KRR-R motif-containing protein 1 n=2 Tax=Macrostomum lignano TaxID=282301 RepID=A0A1I8HP30_9PLAT